MTTQLENCCFYKQIFKVFGVYELHGQWLSIISYDYYKTNEPTKIQVLHTAFLYQDET
ncbi:MAG: hypothetical protein H7196_03805 [candidate division SR1 bacterium]|nr:hypothetical protein [candidate division SR1 bacterium]